MPRSLTRYGSNRKSQVNSMNISTLMGMKRVRMDIPEILGSWEGPVTQQKYIVPVINKIVLMYEQDRQELCRQYGKDKLPIV